MSSEQKQNGNGQSKAIVSGPQARLDTIKALFVQHKDNIAGILPKHLTVDRMTRIAISAASRTPTLLECTPSSLLLAVIQAGMLGLEPSTPMGHCYLVPFANNKTHKKEATLIVGYRGLCQLAYQSGDVTSIYAHEVYEKDDFDIELGTNKRLFHRPLITGDRGGLIGFYAVAKFKHGGDDFNFMPKADVDRIRQGSQGRDSDAWVNHYVEMGKKTPIRRLSKTMPMSEDRSLRFHQAVDIDERTDAGIAPDYGNVIDVLGEVDDPTEQRSTGSRTDQLAENIGSKAS